MEAFSKCRCGHVKYMHANDKLGFKTYCTYRTYRRHARVECGCLQFYSAEFEAKMKEQTS